MRPFFLFLFFICFQRVCFVQTNWDNLQNAYTQLLEQSPKKAIDVAQQQLDIALNSEENRYLSPLSFSNVGNAYFKLKDYQKANFYYKRAVETGEKYLSKNSKLLLTDYNSLAICFQYLGQITQADSVFKDLIARTQNDSNFQKRIITNRIDLHKKDKNTAMVEKLRAQYNMIPDTACDCKKEPLSVIEDTESSIQKSNSVVQLKTNADYQTTPTAQKDKQYHLVEKNDNLYQISKMYNISIEDLIYINKLGSYEIKVGQKLLVVKP